MPVPPPLDIVPAPVPLISGSAASNAARAVRHGELCRVGRGVYAEAAAWRDLAPWDRYLARVHAVAQRHPGAIFVLDSALALRGLPVFGEPAEVHVVTAAPGKSRHRDGVHVHATTRMPALERVGGLLTPTLAETAIGIAHARHPAVGLAVACATLRADPGLSIEALRELSAARPSARGVRTARWVLDRATGVPESTLESVSLAVIEWLGFPTPELQRWFCGPAPGSDDRVDFWWEPWGVAGEADGEVKYSGALGDARTALRARNTRDARLLARGVRSSAHWSLPDLTAPAQLRALLLSAGLPIIRPEQTRPLRTLASALRGAAH